MNKLYKPLIWLVLVAVLAGCGGGGAPAPAATQPAAGQPAAPAATQAPAAGASATVRVLAMDQAALTPEEMNSIADEFMKANPTIKVEVEYAAYDALHDKILTSMAANPPAYDVIAVDDPWYAEFAKAGYLADVSSRITPDMRQKVFKTAWDVTTVDGVVYGLPWLLDQKYFFYNKKMLADAGFNEPPKTWEELLTQAKALKDKGLVEYPIVWSWSQAEAVICDWVTLLYANGGTFLDKDGKPAFNNEAGVETLTWMAKTIDDGYTNPASVSYLEEDVRNVFSQGKAAFALNWNYMFDLANFNKEESQITGNVGVALIPVFEKGAAAGVKSSSINGSMGFSVAAKSPNLDPAWKFIEFLTSEDVQLRYSAHQLPMWESAFQGEALKKLESASPAAAVMAGAFSAQFPYANVRPRAAFYPEGSKALQLAIQQALTKQQSPADALNAAAAKWTELSAK